MGGASQKHAARRRRAGDGMDARGLSIGCAIVAAALLGCTPTDRVYGNGSGGAGGATTGSGGHTSSSQASSSSSSGGGGASASSSSGGVECMVDADCTSGPNATATCAGGKCIRACAMGYGDCDQIAMTGCEVDFASDQGNCGKGGAT